MPTISSHPLLQELVPAGPSRPVSSSLLAELSSLALTSGSLAERARKLYQLLRRHLGQPTLVECLSGVQHLAEHNEPAGARLLAALLDTRPPGARLLPRIHSFGSSRRLNLRLDHGGTPSPELRSWQTRFRSLQVTCRKRAASEVGTGGPAEQPESGKTALRDFRHCLRYLVAALYRQKGELAAADTALLIDLARLEVDALEQRISQLATMVNPYRIAAVKRMLPLLSAVDTEVRDLRGFISLIEQGQVQRAFHERLPRMDEVFDQQEKAEFLRIVQQARPLQPLAELLLAQRRTPMAMPQLAACCARLMALAHQLRLRGQRSSDLDLLTAALIAQRQGSAGELTLSLEVDLGEVMREILRAPQGGAGIAQWPLDGFRLDEDALILHLSGLDQHEGSWPDDLPAVAVKEDPAQQEVSPDQSVHALKRLVLCSLSSVSVLQGLLRNPKIMGIPGLVTEVVQRCRSLVILDQIANDRRLYSGFANKDVPRALLRSPCNISVRTLRKFIHVKYIDKVELQRMAKDKTGLRDEVGKEITKYLKSLQ